MARSRCRRRSAPAASLRSPDAPARIGRLADTASRVMLPCSVRRRCPRLPLARWLHAPRARAPRRRRSRPRRSRAGGLRHAASQGRGVRGRSRCAIVVVRDGATRREQSSTRVRSRDGSRAGVVDVRAAIAGASADAGGGSRGDRSVRRGPADAGTRCLSHGRARGAQRSGDRERARPRPRHDVLAHPARAPAIRAGDDGRPCDRAVDGRARCGQLRWGARR